MSTYPGPDPDGPEADGTPPPTDEVGYWERRAAEERSPQQAPWGGPEPTAPYPAGGYGPPPGGQWGAPPAGYGQPAWGGGGPWSAPVPNHPSSTTALVLGLISLVGAFFTCGLTLLAGPFAWGVGRSALREIEASGGRLGGGSAARTGMVTGIISTVVLVLVVVAVVGLGVVAFSSVTSVQSY